MKRTKKKKATSSFGGVFAIDYIALDLSLELALDIKNRK
jgi:hypothetical protein